MNIRLILSYIGQILCIEALLLLPAAAISLYQGETAALIGLAVTAAVLLAAGWALSRIRPARRTMYVREGMATVGLTWVLISLFGALPFYLSGAIPSYIDCFFETVSGFTTTGASILSDVEALPMGLLYWRSFTHWLGGMGVLVFFLALANVARKGEGSAFHILQAESPGPSVGKLVPKLAGTAGLLYRIYVALTLLQILLLLLGGMPLFDSVLNAFATAGTGGFSIKNASIAAYDSVYLQAVIGIFMALFGMNFNVFYLLLVREFSRALMNEELWLYWGTLLGSSVLIALNVRHLFSGVLEAFHHSFFQVSSIMTTTGFATCDFDRWPEFSRILLLLLMIVGASAGSTGGGIKVVRLLILFKSVKAGIQKQFYPHSVRLVRLDGRVLDEDIIRGVYVYFGAYFLIAAVSVLALAAGGCDLDTALSAELACLNNIGPGLSLVGPTANYGFLQWYYKLLLSLNMLVGRLEIFPMLLLFSPSVWLRGLGMRERAGKRLSAG